MGTFLCAVVYGVAKGEVVAIKECVVMGLATLCVDMGTTGFNTFFDYYHGTDNATYTKEREKVLVHEQVNPLWALSISLGLFFVAAMLGLYLASQTSWYLIVVGAVSMMVGFFYTAGPYPISRTPLGELFAGGFLGSVLFLITLYVIDFPLDVQAVLATTPFFLLIAMILSVNNGCDRIGDTASGRHTLSILLGKQGSLYLVLLEAVSAYAVTVVLSLRGVFPRLLLIPLAPVVILFSFSYANVYRTGMDEEHKAQHMGFASRTFITYCAAYLLAFSIGFLFPAS